MLAYQQSSKSNDRLLGNLVKGMLISENRTR